MAIEHDQDALLELMELAVTWPELEYSETRTIPPDSWMAFVESHRWVDPDRVERIFGIATDIAMTAKRALGGRGRADGEPAFGVTITEAEMNALPVETTPIREIRSHNTTE